MQIRLTVLGPRAGQAGDVLVTAPAGTSLGTVAGALSASAGAGQSVRSGASVTLYAQGRRLDPDSVLGHPPLVDGAAIALYPPTDDPVPQVPPSAARLHVVGGPDAGGVHLLHGGQIRIGRSAEADVPLDDPDVSRLHTVVTVEPPEGGPAAGAGTVSVADLDSTNGTTLDGVAVDQRPVPFTSGALLRIGESTLRLELPRAPADEAGSVPPPPASRPAVPDGEGHLKVSTSVPVRSAPAAPAPEPVPAAEPSDSPGTRAKALAKRLTTGLSGGKTADPRARDRLVARAAELRDRWPDPAELLLAALGPGARLWERGVTHEDALMVRLGTADLPASSWSTTGSAQDSEHLAQGVGRSQGAAPQGARAGSRTTAPDSGADALLPAAPIVVDLQRWGSLGIAGPRPRLSGLARSVVAQLCALHPPGALELVLISTDRARDVQLRTEEWSWLRWVPQLRPGHGQDCRLLLGLDGTQVQARLSELTRRMEHGPLGPSWAGADLDAVARASAGHPGPCTVLVVDGHPDSVAAAQTVARLLVAGPATGVFTICLAEAPDELPPECAALALLGGDVATEVRVQYPVDPARDLKRHRQPGRAPGGEAGHHPAMPPESVRRAAPGGGTPLGQASPGAVGGGSVATVDGVTVDAVSAAWAERFARALAPLREAESPRLHSALPQTSRLLDTLGLALATPAKVSARWSELPDTGGTATAVVGVAADGRCVVDLVREGPHLLVGGAPGAGKTELLRSVAASLAAADRPDRLALVLIDGAGDHGEGLSPCTDLPHVTTHLAAVDPVRLRELAQALTAELGRREKLLGGRDFAAWQAEQLLTLSRTRGLGTRRGETASGSAPVNRWGSTAGQGPPAGRRSDQPPMGPGQGRGGPGQGGSPAAPGRTFGPGQRPADDRVPRQAAGQAHPVRAGQPARPEPDRRTPQEADSACPRLVVVVDDFDALVAPALGSPARQAAGSMVRALDAIAVRGPRLGVHLVVATGRPEHTSGGEVDEQARLRIALRTDDPAASRLLVHIEDAAGLDEAVPGRGYLRRKDGSVTPFQSGRVSGRIPRTATLRPTVVPLEWQRMGDPPTRRTPRELGNGPTDLALLASALQRAAQSASAAPASSLVT